MGRYCYCSLVLPGKKELVQAHWKNKEKAAHEEEEEAFWSEMKMTGFECWLQGDHLIHCLEGESLQQIFKGLRTQIAVGNKIALKLRAFYLEILGKDYAHHNVEPQIEQLSSITLPAKTNIIKRAFFYPLLKHKEDEHRRFRIEKRHRHEKMMEAFGVYHLSTWLQSTPQGKYIIVYTERDEKTPENAAQRLAQGGNSLEWKEISAELMSHTGLEFDELSPDVEWLTRQTCLN